MLSDADMQPYWGGCIVSGVCPFERDQKVFDEVKKLGGNMKLTAWKGDRHGVSGKFITGADNGVTQLSSKRCDPEPVFLKWLFKQKRPPKKTKQPTSREKPGPKETEPKH